MTLGDFFAENPRAALAFSGGADSAYLLYAAKKYAKKVRPYYIKTQFQPRFELEDAMRLCRELELELEVIELDILSAENVAENSEVRCYHCKTALFTALIERAHKDGFELVIDGTNASDESSDRPGMRALSELGVRSPLRECGITKPELRRLSAEAGLFTAEKPAYACLATRIPTGEEITASKLQTVERAENELFKLGYSDFRVRLRKGSALLQVAAAQYAKAEAELELIRERLGGMFSDLLLDPKRRGT